MDMRVGGQNARYTLYEGYSVFLCSRLLRL